MPSVWEPCICKMLLSLFPDVESLATTVSVTGEGKKKKKKKRKDSKKGKK